MEFFRVWQCLLVVVTRKEPPSLLSYAASCRDFSAGVAMLLKRVDIEVDSNDAAGRTPLSYAAERGVKDSLRFLLERTT